MRRHLYGRSWSRCTNVLLHFSTVCSRKYLVERHSQKWCTSARRRKERTSDRSRQAIHALYYRSSHIASSLAYSLRGAIAQVNINGRNVELFSVLPATKGEGMNRVLLDRSPAGSQSPVVPLDSSDRYPTRSVRKFTHDDVFP